MHILKLEKLIIWRTNLKEIKKTKDTSGFTQSQTKEDGGSIAEGSQPKQTATMS